MRICSVFSRPSPKALKAAVTRPCCTAWPTHQASAPKAATQPAAGSTKAVSRPR